VGPRALAENAKRMIEHKRTTATMNSKEERGKRPNSTTAKFAMPESLRVLMENEVA